MPAYDVAVAGAGPAGLQFARSVASRSEYDVVVLEANGSLADNDKSTGGTFGEAIRRFDVPDAVVMDETDAVVFEAGGATGRVPASGYVLDFPALLEHLGDDAADHGATVRTGARVTDAVIEDGRVAGVELGGGRERVTADVVVDATGPATALVEDLGLFDPGGATRAVGKEYEVEGEHAVDDMLFRFDHDLAPGGYAWAFPAGAGVLKAGVCWLDTYYEANATDRTASIDDYVDRWLASDDRWTVDRRRAVHAGSAYIDDSLSRRATDGLVAVGDSVASINPLLGEGIRPGMNSAEMAADAVVDALDAGDVSRERLAAYERRWKRDRGRHWRRQNLISHLFYGFDADQQRRFVQKIDGLSPAQVERFEAYDLTLRDYLSVYPLSGRDLLRVPRVLRRI
ncbi:MAG: NAD(P)/FAD-dependent oxidoreductase [Halosimplex sp.]